MQPDETAATLLLEHILSEKVGGKWEKKSLRLCRVQVRGIYGKMFGIARIKEKAPGGVFFQYEYVQQAFSISSLF